MKIIGRVIDLFINKLLSRLVGDYGYLFSPRRVLQVEASLSTINYIKSDMLEALLLDDRYQVLEYALGEVKTEGGYFEFGVRSGDTVNFIARHKPGEVVYGFDSFEGLPEDWSGYSAQKGDFSVGNKPSVEENVELVEGWFDDSLPTFLANTNAKFAAFIHIDSDLYSSAVTIFTNLASHIGKGTVIVFDEYFNYPSIKNRLSCWKSATHQFVIVFLRINTFEARTFVRVFFLY